MSAPGTGPGPGAAARAGVLVIGECLVDLAQTAAAGDGPGRPRQTARRFVAMPGGGPANVAVGLARLGAHTLFAARLSRYGLGPWLRQNLVANGVDLSLAVDAPEAATLAVVTLDGEGRASYTFYGPETADWQWHDDELPEPNQAALEAYGVGAVHTGSIAVAYEPGGPVLARWLARLRRDNDVLISFDPNVRMAPGSDTSAYVQRLEDIIASSHIVKASNEDVAAISPGSEPGHTAEKWLGAGVSLVLITEGPDGATAFHRNGFTAHLSPPGIEVADTIGAGDAFSAGLLAYFADQGLLHPEGVAGATAAQLTAALRQAVATSAFTCTRHGGDPPATDELGAFVAAHQAWAAGAEGAGAQTRP